MSNARILGPTQVTNPNNISIGAAVFAKVTAVTDTQTMLCATPVEIANRGGVC